VRMCVRPHECGWDISNNDVSGCGSVYVYVCVLHTVWGVEMQHNAMCTMGVAKRDRSELHVRPSSLL
jgi:hypothetical protein